MFIRRLQELRKTNMLRGGGPKPSFRQERVTRKAISRSEMIHGDFAIVSSLLADQMLYSDVFAATMDQSRVTNKRKANS